MLGIMSIRGNLLFTKTANLGLQNTFRSLSVAAAR